jgi:hypothetical protein
MTSNYYHHLPNLPLLPQKFIDEGLAANYPLKFLPTGYYSPSSFTQTNFVKRLEKEFGFCCSGFLKNLPNSYYDWHIDLDRYCAINWVIKTNPRAVTMYREIIPTPPEIKKKFLYNIFEVEYSLAAPTLLNTAEEHCVVNPHHEERIILTTIIKPAKFVDVRDFLSQLQIIEY